MDAVVALRSTMPPLLNLVLMPKHISWPVVLADTRIIMIITLPLPPVMPLKKKRHPGSFD
jgi:hypothetical protein